MTNCRRVFVALLQVTYLDGVTWMKMCRKMLQVDGA